MLLMGRVRLKYIIIASLVILYLLAAVIEHAYTDRILQSYLDNGEAFFIEETQRFYDNMRGVDILRSSHCRDVFIKIYKTSICLYTGSGLTPYHQVRIEEITPYTTFSKNLLS